MGDFLLFLFSDLSFDGDLGSLFTFGLHFHCWHVSVFGFIRTSTLRLIIFYYIMNRHRKISTFQFFLHDP